MREEADDTTSDSDTSGLPWSGWLRTLPVMARDAVSEVDLAAPYVYLSPPAQARELPIARAELRRWSEAVGLGSGQTMDVVLAVDEAVANAIEHGYGDQPGVVTVFAGCLALGSKVCVVVSDIGHWRTPPADIGFRGRGVSMMKALADQFDLYHNENGTTVLLRWSVR
jgi:serine/threonine-protein kinase RsbW